MFTTLIKKIFGSRNERILKRMGKVVSEINALEAGLKTLTNEQLSAKTTEFKKRIAGGETLDSLLPEAFAVVREASMRTLGLRHFDVQLIGGMVLHEGNIAEMRTGEGKTLMSTLTAYLNALSGKGVHLVTINDYLAKRDNEWMKPIYDLLGITTGVIMPNMPLEEKQAAYGADITYGTNNEFGFDYLRDNMAFSANEKVQRDIHFAIVDEVDSILIDEARTPLIISGAAEDSSELYIKINRIVPKLVKQAEENGPGDFSIDEKQKQAYLTEAGHQRVEELLLASGMLQPGDSLYSATNITVMHHINASLRAHALFQRDVDYIVQNGEVVIVDEHTGRTMPGRRWSDGLHQAVEAKEGVKIQNENQTLASITFQNYFRLYNKLAGMTGTADTEAYEFQQIYNLEVVVIPTNKPMIRNDMGDQVYLTVQDKYTAVIADILECRSRQQPVLVGTASIDASEVLSQLLKKEKIPHNVLNAKFHEKEAGIIADAGRPGMVTIATNMAGRGTDIVLGGSLAADIEKLGENPTPEAIASTKAAWQQRHDQVIQAGGLRIVGSERHESRRIDNQLRGRAGRQGDPGSSRFYLSLEDNLMRIFASDRVAILMKRLGMQPGEAIEHGLVNKAIENAQRKVEGFNFDVRKQLLQYDDVANDQRKVMYAQRNEILMATDIGPMIEEIRNDVLTQLVFTHIPPESLEEQWDVAGLQQKLMSEFGLKLPIQEWIDEQKIFSEEKIIARILEAARDAFLVKQNMIGRESMAQFEKSVMLQTMDHQWREHLANMEHLRQGIHLRGFAQKDPKQEYKRESFNLFSSLLDNLKHDVVSILSTVQIQAPADVDTIEQQRREQSDIPMEFQHADLASIPQEESDDGRVIPMRRDMPKIGRNDPCPCGSGRKFKQCHGKI